MRCRGRRIYFGCEGPGTDPRVVSNRLRELPSIRFSIHSATRFQWPDMSGNFTDSGNHNSSYGNLIVPSNVWRTWTGFAYMDNECVLYVNVVRGIEKMRHTILAACAQTALGGTTRRSAENIDRA